MESSSFQTHYEVLGITQQAQLKEVRDAYRKMALKCHPDKDPDNPRAVVAFQKLGAAYETLSNEHRRTIYDATLSSSQRARQTPQPADGPPQRSSNSKPSTQTWQDYMRRRAWNRARAQEEADQARRDDADFWSGPTYAHGPADRTKWGKQRDREQKDDYDLYEKKQRQRAARKEARKDAERQKRDMNMPPSRGPYDQGTEESKARAERYKKKQEAQEKAERERHEDDENLGRSPSPQRADPDWSDKAQKEYQERLKKEKKERADRRKARREQFEKESSAKLPLLLSEIIGIGVDITKAQATVDEPKSANKDEIENEDCEHIFAQSIKQKSLERRLRECLDEYRRTIKFLRDRGREREANEANVKLREARKGVARDERAGGQGSSQGGQGAWTTKTKTRSIAKKAQGKPSANDEGSYHDQKLTTPQPPEPSKPQHNNAERPVKSTLPMYGGQNDETMTQQQKSPCGQVACPRVSYDSSDPDRGFTEDTPESSVAANDNNYNGENYDPRFCNAFHHLHMEVHREFWDIIDCWHECNFCHQTCTVMRCPKCDVQACAYCKNTPG